MVRIEVIRAVTMEDTLLRYVVRQKVSDFSDISIFYVEE
jgi:hypothetical protein